MDIISILNYLGITHDRILPFVILTLEMVYICDRFTAPIKRELVKMRYELVRMKNAIIEMQVVFENSGIHLRHYLIEGSSSPLAPTEGGEQMLIESGLGKILGKHAALLRAALVEKLPANYGEYDVQEKARELMIELKGNEIMSPVKKYAFDNGLDVGIILKAGGLWLRDDFLGRKRLVNKTGKT